MELSPAQVSVIVTTYNRPDALRLVLLGLAAQDAEGFEVLVADDGSATVTESLVRELGSMLPYPIRHVWQEDRGFRAAAARNRALARTARAYIVFIDGDCVPRRDFIRHHCDLAEAGWFVAGNRLLCNARFSAEVLRRDLPVWEWELGRWLPVRLRGGINRLLPLLLSLPDLALRKHWATRWEGAKSCNLGAWRADLVAVNGFDESYQGWGYEDADLVVRLIRNGILRKEGRWAVPVIHLWHPERDRGGVVENLRRLRAVLAEDRDVVAQLGMDRY